MLLSCLKLLGILFFELKPNFLPCLQDMIILFPTYWLSIYWGPTMCQVLSCTNGSCSYGNKMVKYHPAKPHFFTSLW